MLRDHNGRFNYSDKQGASKRAMMAAPIAVTGSTFEPGPPILFPTQIDGEGADIVEAPQYDVAADGRFLINTVLDSAAAQITLLMNWQPDAQK